MSVLFCLILGGFLVFAWLTGRTGVAEWTLRNLRWMGPWIKLKQTHGIKRVLMWEGIMGIVIIIQGLAMLLS
jgi:hypothetical protein